MKRELEFPKGFLWGSAVSSYQVEGGVENCNWSKAFPAGKACNYYNDYEKYFDIAQNLNHNVHRLSLEWSRIEPVEGKIDKQAIEHYKKILKSLHDRNIKTMVTLWHSTTPAWITEKGGWTNPQISEYFRKYTVFVARELNPYVDFWITINEPMISVSHPYILGVFPPQHKNDFIGAVKAVRNFVAAHKKAYRAIKLLHPDTKVAMAENYSFVEAYDKHSALNKLTVFLWDFARNRLFLELTKKEQDFLGINFYFHEKLILKKGKPYIQVANDNAEVSDLGWEIFPRGIYEVIKILTKYDLPIYITENGIADKDDKYRAKYIKEHLRWVHRAIEEGSDVRGYLYWSLLDNFEWADGFDPRFGLIEVNYNDLSYKIRTSALEYAKICKDNKLIIEE